VLFVALGHRVLFRLAALEQGCVYFAWAAVQQVVYQSMTYMPFRNNLRSRGLAAGLSGLAFALAHLPNPVLVAGTLVWGVAASLLFERCRSVWGLALIQVMLSSMLLWVTPAELSRDFHIGPYYYEIHSRKAPGARFAPPIATPR
jgi:membrane protease YdiL (CAAX protease family)